MKKICTKTGDQGLTSLRGGVRVDKDDIRIDTNGEIDQLNALLGIVRSNFPESNSHHEFLVVIQRELMTVMSHVATPDGEVNPKPLHTTELTSKMENLIANAAPPVHFVVPGATELSSFLHLARAQARRAERRLWTLNRVHPVKSGILEFMNRLSDYLFLLALENE